MRPALRQRTERLDNQRRPKPKAPLETIKSTADRYSVRRFLSKCRLLHNWTAVSSIMFHMDTRYMKENGL